MKTAYIGQLHTKEIIDGLYLGNLDASNNHEFLQSESISVILNVCETPNKKYENIEYHHFPLVDEPTENIYKHFKTFFEIIDNALKEKKKILVHCFAGVSRSGTVIIGYIMHSQHITLKEAYQIARRKKRDISPNRGFWNQLCVYELELLKTQKPSYLLVDYITDYIYDFLDSMYERDVIKQHVIDNDCDLTDSLNSLFAN